MRQNGQKNRYHQECRMLTYIASPTNPGMYIEYNGIMVVLSSLPSVNEKTVILSTFFANWENKRTDPNGIRALEWVLLRAIKKLFNIHVRIVTHSAWFDVRGGIKSGLNANKWFAKEFNLPKSNVSQCIIIQPGDPSM